ncbi:MAG: ricin-type beta-trefoil lectin domain protein [Renibacterium salmoninarum]|nr:ricin-type beta-trefoil lectin domain protein [Renibacterium salmoninarum]
MKKLQRQKMGFVLASTSLVISLVASGMLASSPAAATPAAAMPPAVAPAPQVAEEPASPPRTEQVPGGTDLGKDCSKTSDEILQGLWAMGGNDKVTTVRHRGDFDADTPENSLAAFRNSYQACRPGIETDVRKTKDGQFVLFHDTKIGKMLEPGYNPETDTGPNAALDSLTYDQLRAKDLVKIDRTVSDQKIINLETFLRDYVNTKGRSIINLEIKSDSDVLDVIKAFNRINKQLTAIDLYTNTIFKFRMTAYATDGDFRKALEDAGIDSSKVAAMPVMSAQISQQLNERPVIVTGQSNTYTAVDSWSNTPAPLVPSVEVVMKDAQGYKEYTYEFPYYGETNSYLDMVPMTVPASATFQNTRNGTMAEMSELVKSRSKPLATFVPIPDWAMWRKNLNWDTPLPNTVAGSPTLSPREAYFNNDSKCCYALSDRLAGDKLDQEKADQRILLPFQEKVKATVLTADDTDSIDSYFKDKGNYLDLGDNKVKPNAPNPAMNSLIYPGERIPRAAVAQTTNKSIGPNQLINAQFRLCAASSSSKIRSWQCNTNDKDGRWDFKAPDADGYRRLELNNGGYCLDSKGELGLAIIWPCATTTNGMWKFRSDGSIVDKATKGCLTLTGNQPGSPVETQPCNGSGRQQWLTDYAENSWGDLGRGQGRMLVDNKTGNCLTLDNPSGEDYTDIWVVGCENSAKQRWGTWNGMVNGQGGYSPRIASDIKAESGWYYMCMGNEVGVVLGYSCGTGGRVASLQWYFTPDGQVVNIRGQCLKNDGGRATMANCSSWNPTTWTASIN